MSTTKLRVVALVHRHLIPPDTIEEGTDIESAPWRTEHDVITTLTAMGHEVKALPVHDDLGEIRRLVTEWKPHIAYNLLEGFDDITIFDQNVVSHLELLKLSYTGCNPRGLLLARDKSLSKKLLAYHRIAVPEFEVVRIGRPIRRPKRLPFPLMVKSLTQDASIGIAQLNVPETSPPTVTCPPPNSIGSDGSVWAYAVAAAQARNSHASPAAAILQTFMVMRKL